MEEIKSLSTRSKVVMASLGGFILAAGAGAYGSLQTYQLASDATRSVYDPDELEVIASGLEDITGIAALVYIGFFLLAAVTFCVWLVRAIRNAQAASPMGLSFSPRWAVWCFFIPILCLWKPYQAMRELWCASNSPRGWHVRERSWVLPLWWTAWMLACAMGQSLFRWQMMQADGPEQIMLLSLGEIAAYGVDVLSAGLLMWIVLRISAMQDGRNFRQSAATRDVEYPGRRAA